MPPVCDTACCRRLGQLLSPPFFKALADPNRITLLIRLADCSRACTVSEIASCCQVDLSVVSRHLALLRAAGILHAEKRGKQVYYSVRCDAIVRTLRDTADCLERCCPPTRLTPATHPTPPQRASRSKRRPHATRSKGAR